MAQHSGRSQKASVRGLLKSPQAIPLTVEQMDEAVWTLRSAFDQDKAEQLLAIRSLLNETAFAFEDRDAVTQAADMFEHGNGGFSDCLVVAKHVRHGCDFTATFDRGMRKLPRVKLL